MQRRRLEAALKKSQPLPGPEQQALLELAAAADWVTIRYERLLQGHGLTRTQFEVLRILQSAGRPLPILEVAARLSATAPGITGLVDRLQRKGLVGRRRSRNDGRVVFVSLTLKGLRQWRDLHGLVREAEAELTGRLSAEELQELRRLMVKLRSASPDAGEACPFSSANSASAGLVFAEAGLEAVKDACEMPGEDRQCSGPDRSPSS